MKTNMEKMFFFLYFLFVKKRINLLKRKKLKKMYKTRGEKLDNCVVFMSDTTRQDNILCDKNRTRHDVVFF